MNKIKFFGPNNLILNIASWPDVGQRLMVSNTLFKRLLKLKILENFVNLNGETTTQNDINLNINVQYQKFKVISRKSKPILYFLSKFIKFLVSAQPHILHFLQKSNFFKIFIVNSSVLIPNFFVWTRFYWIRKAPCQKKTFFENKLC